jgi:glyoxylase-like metal-dependent hydrolase (beta-lactamase superfamily II)
MPGSYVLRQNKCRHFEAPFLYLLVGDQRALLLDTGARAKGGAAELRATVDGLLQQHRTEGAEALPLLVLHTHGHSDHTAGDAAFTSSSGTELVPAEPAAIQAAVGMVNWPHDQGRLDLGNRMLTVLAVPGHHEQSIAVYDDRTGWLLSGDTLFPGQIVVKDWPAYRASVQKLTEFAAQMPVTEILGGHIERAADGSPYPIGLPHHPDEAALPFGVADLQALNAALAARTRLAGIELDRLTVVPMSAAQRVIGGLLKAVGVR